MFGSETSGGVVLKVIAPVLEIFPKVFWAFLPSDYVFFL
jgi:hypothetical protein